MWFVFLFSSLSVNLFPILRLLIDSIINIRFPFYLLSSIIWPISNISHLTHLTHATRLPVSCFSSSKLKKRCGLGKEAARFPQETARCQSLPSAGYRDPPRSLPPGIFYFLGGLGAYESTTPKRQEREGCGELHFQSQYPQQITLAKRLK